MKRGGQTPLTLFDSSSCLSLYGNVVVDDDGSNGVRRIERGTP